MLWSSILSCSQLLHTVAPRKRVIWGVVFTCNADNAWLKSERSTNFVCVEKYFDFLILWVNEILFCKIVPFDTNFISIMFEHDFAKTLSRKKRLWIPLNFFLMHLFFKLWARWNSFFSEVFPYLWTWSLLPFSITYSGIDRRSNMCSMKPRLVTVSSQEMPTCTTDDAFTPIC